MSSDPLLADLHTAALDFERRIGQIVLGQEQAIRLLTVAVFARGHVLLEGGVGVGKTTLLRAVARGIGGQYERIEGTIDLMPNDLIYYTYLDEKGKPGVAPGPLLKQGEALSTFFFNEINRARPQVHSLLLRVMAERTLSAFNREFRFPNLQVFADRNRVEREETFDLPAAARDRFIMEIRVDSPADRSLLDRLMADPRFHDVDALIESVPAGLLPYERLNDAARVIQSSVHVSERLRQYVLDLAAATLSPETYGIVLEDTDGGDPIEAGLSPRGLSFLLRLARVHAWMNGRDRVLPEDVQQIFRPASAHRIFLKPVYEYRRAELMTALLDGILQAVAAP
jgi:MoxR-like ATPase